MQNDGIIEKYCYNNIEDSCRLAGICKQTYYNWIENKIDFIDAIKKAESKFKQKNIEIIQNAAMIRQSPDGKIIQGQWTAAAWLLERKFRDEFAIKQNIEHSGEIKNKIEPIQIEFIKPK